MVVTLSYLRRNHVQQELGEFFGASQPTISRTIAQGPGKVVGCGVSAGDTPVMV